MNDEASLTAGDAKALNDIDQYGLHILHVVCGGDKPDFSYSIGVEATLRMPEVMVVGLRPELSQSIINDYYRRARAGEVVGNGASVADLIDRFDCRMVAVDVARFADAFGWARWLYQDKPFRMLQIVYPDLDGRWPDDPSVNPALLRQQPVLSRPDVVFP